MSKPTGSFAYSTYSVCWIPTEPGSYTSSYSLPPAPWLPTPVRAAPQGAFNVPGDAELQRAMF